MEMVNMKPSVKGKYSDAKYRSISFAVSALALIVLWPRDLVDKEVLVLDIVTVVIVTLVNMETGVFIKNHKRSGTMVFGLYETSVIPVFVHMLIVLNGYWEYTKGLVFVVAISLAYIAFSTVWHKRRSKRHVKRDTATGMYRVQALLLIVLIIQVWYTSFVVFGSSDLDIDAVQDVSTTKSAYELQEWGDDRTVAAYYDTLRVLEDEEQFALVDVQERFRIFTALCDVFANNLGVPYKLTIKAEPIKEDGVLGQYTHRSRTIIIDEGYLATGSAEGIIKVAAHEVRHAYTWAVINLNKELTDPASRILLADLLNEGEKYAESYATYTDDGPEYFSQYVEVDSRNYADQAYIDLIERLTELEGEQ